MEPDVTGAMNEMRRSYRMALGQSPDDPGGLTYEQKAKKLASVFGGEPQSDVPDPVLYSLLRSRAVQEFNGEGWFGVHPLVVDTLKEHGVLPSDSPGGSI